MRYSVLTLAVSIPATALILTGASPPERGLAARVAELEAQVEAMEAQFAAMEEWLQYVRVEPEEINGLRGPHVIFEGANLHVRSGQGQTRFPLCPGTCPETKGGLGNLVVGYNEGFPSQARLRFGMHNVVVGPEHQYMGTGGLVAGKRNSIWNSSTSVTGGIDNIARGSFSSVSGGHENLATGTAASVGGGRGNVASGHEASVSGGQDREALDEANWVAGSLFESN
jgi:hypothetical protein